MTRDAALWWDGSALCLLDQTALPHDVRILRCTAWPEVAHAIRTLQVRGAPAIGVAAAYGMALAARAAAGGPQAEARAVLAQAAEELLRTRPTAVNLGWAVRRMLEAARGPSDAGSGQDGPRAPQAVAERLLAEAHAVAAANVEANRRMGEHGAALLPAGAHVLTYCNTGMLACGEYGTAFGVLRCAHDQGRAIEVLACETRPVLQGARLTMWELSRAGIPATLITDNAAAALMRKGNIDLVVVGADRIAANGDVANKVGTYALAVLARAHGIPFYVTAPLSTVDLRTPSGDAIPIEERAAAEVTDVGGVRVAPPGVRVHNPAFDVTPHEYVTAIVTEAGVLRPPYTEALRAASRAASPLGPDTAPRRAWT